MSNDLELIAGRSDRMNPDESWPKVVEAFSHYGKRITFRLRGARRRLIERLSDEGYEADDLVAAVHGYVRFHNGLEPRDGFEPAKYFTPESVFRFEKLEPRIELGIEGPWRKPISREDAIKARQKAAQERVRAAREAREGMIQAVRGAA